ncbi:MAG: hypothetical protein LBK61_10195 [Spirochaetaceae bacterium]|jgi:hypothetical protein|nr:hypothetical protein [Spirochaetaceae bacterium]
MGKTVFGCVVLLLTGIFVLAHLAACSGEEPPAYAVGDAGPAGGVIFLVEGSGGNYVYYEAAPADCPGTAPWGGDTPAETDATVGTGKANTAAMLAANPDEGTAARLCAGYRGGDKDDWFLPSNLELKAMKMNLHRAGKGNFSNAGYWSSTGFRGRYANGWDFGAEGEQGYTQNRETALRVRAARSF